jgi:hypothetical protein
MLQQDDQCEAGVYTNVDSANPFRLLLGFECSPFSPYRWLCTGTLLVRTRHSQCRPKEGQKNRKEVVEGHVWARYFKRYFVNGGTDSESIYLTWHMVKLCVPTPRTSRGETEASTGRKSRSDHRKVQNGHERLEGGGEAVLSGKAICL